MLLVLIVGLLMNAIALPLAARRVHFLYRVISSGQPAPDRIQGVTRRLGGAVKRQVVEVFGQKKLLKWSVPGAAHFFVFWAFVILATVYLEAYGNLLKIIFQGNDTELDWAIPIVGHWPLLGFLQDFIAMMAFFGILTFVVIRFRNAPKELGRRSRFFGSHLSGAWITLFMIFNVIWTMFLFRGASSALGNLPYKSGAFISIGVGNLLDGMSHSALSVLEGVGLLLHIGVMLVFLIFVLNSKHLHIFVAPLNVLFGRTPVALGAAKPMTSAGKPLTLEDLEDLDEDDKLGVGAAEDFSWKGVLDFTTCTECGRCQDQCPAWNTEKPLSPKLMIMALRDHTLAKAPYLLADEDKREALLEGNTKLATEVERPLVGDTGDEWFYMPEDGSGVIDPDVLWSCVTCGACVQQCPVDIEHVDHIVDMRRYQVLVESNFPAELNGLFKGLENKGNPWNMSSTARLDWAKDLPFEVKVVGEDIESLDEVEWLFWVGCAGAYEDRAKKTTRAVAELLDMAGVSFGILGNGETCTGDSARRAGNEFVFQGLAAQNIETFKEYKVKKAVTTCAHCFNTLKNEYRQLGIELEVVHHTQLLNRLVREKKLTPMRAPERSWNGPHRRPITYHDPCYLGRHNQVYEAPRELLNVLPDTTFVEMPRNSERSFCCGAGGARMWMEETIGTRINETRTAEAVGTGAEKIATGCPYCRVMLSDGLTSAQSKGEAREEVEVLDVAQLLLASVKGETKKPAKQKVEAASGSGGGGTSTATIEREETSEETKAEETKAEPEAGDTTQTEDTVTETEDVGAGAGSGGGGSLFDLGDESDEPKDEPSGEVADQEEPGPDVAEAAESRKPESTTSADSDDESASTGGGSLFDIGGDDDVEEKAPDEDVDRSQDDADTDVESEEDQEEPEARSKPEDTASSAAATAPANEIPEGGSLFDIEGDDDVEEKAPDEDVDRSEDDADTDVEPEQDQEEPEPEKETEAEAEPEPEPDAETEPEPEAKESPSSGTGITPASEIPEGGSLFDIAEPEETEVSRPAATEDKAEEPEEPEAKETEEDKGEDAAADSTTDGDVDRADDAADTDVEPDEEKAEAEDKADEEREQPEQPEDGDGSGLGGKYPAGQSMFDVPDDDASTKEPASEPKVVESAESEEPAAEEEPEAKQDSAGDSAGDSGITSLRDIKAKLSGGESTEEPAGEDAAGGSTTDEDVDRSQDAADTDVEPDEDEPEPDEDQPEPDEDEPEKKAQPAGSGETHEPKTDKDIGEAGSLFDL